MALNISELPPSRMRGDSLDECIEKIRRIYGRDFHVVRHKQISAEGIFGFLKRKQCEVLYTVLPRDSRKIPSALSVPDMEEEKRKLLALNKNTGNPQMKLILDELAALKRNIDEKTSVSSADTHPSLVRIRELLLKNEFTPAYIQEIIDTVRKECSLDELDDFEKIQKSVVDWIGERINIAAVEYISYPQIIVLVGPTGVGKTTSVAKLAAKYAALTEKGQHCGKRVRIITIDTYRIGAKQQLETYGDLMGIPVSLVESAEDMRKILTMYAKDVDIILVDTTGRSPKDYEGLGKMRSVLDLHGFPSRIFLTVSAATKAADLRTIMQQYEIFGYQSLIVTKMDETDCIGSVLSIMHEKNKSAAYLTVGQRVPSDFEKATKLRMLLQLSEFKIDREHIGKKFSAEGAE